MRDYQANLEGYGVGEFLIESLAGRTPGGEKRWRVVCQRCGHPQVIDHRRLAHLVQSRRTQSSLRCASPACELHRQHNPTESFEEFRRRERREAEQAAAQAAEVQRAAEAAAAEKRAADARLAALQAEYRVFWNHQIQTDIEERQIATFRRWCELQPGTREVVMNRIKADPTVCFLNL